MFESVGVNPGGVGGANRSPIASCKTPTVWAPLNPAGNTGIVLVDALNLNGGIKTTADIETQLNVYNPGGGIENGVTSAFICFTPLGHTYSQRAPAGLRRPAADAVAAGVPRHARRGRRPDRNGSKRAAAAERHGACVLSRPLSPRP